MTIVNVYRMGKVFFTADLHFGAVGTLRYLGDRPYSGMEDSRLHDRWLMELWKSTVNGNDRVFILGDMCSYDRTKARILLDRLPGHKVLIPGNHDTSLDCCRSSFDIVRLILNTHFRKADHTFLAHTMQVSMCHYPMLTWQGKPHGSIMLHGHSHGKMDEVNRICPDLRWDVGIDGYLSRQIGKRNGNGFALVDLESLYTAVTEKTGGIRPGKYVRDTYRTEQPPELISALQCSDYFVH